MVFIIGTEKYKTNSCTNLSFILKVREGIIYFVSQECQYDTMIKETTEEVVYKFCSQDTWPRESHIFPLIQDEICSSN